MYMLRRLEYLEIEAQKKKSRRVWRTCRDGNRGICFLEMRN